jgi:hypothetical protein
LFWLIVVIAVVFVLLVVYLASATLTGGSGS